MRSSLVGGMTVTVGFVVAGLLVLTFISGGHHTRSSPNTPAGLAILNNRISSKASANPSPEGPISNLQTSELVLLKTADQAPSWAIHFGKEFWRRSSTPGLPSRLSQTLSAPFTEIRSGEVIDRVSHAFRSNDRGTRVTVEALTYTAKVEKDAMAIVPHKPTGVRELESDVNDPPVEARIRTRLVRRGEQAIVAETTARADSVVIGNTKQTLLDPGSGLVEHLEARDSGIELAWVLPKALTGEGDLTIETEVGGLRYGQQTPTGMHLEDSAGLARIRIGPVTARDISGRNWPVPVEFAGNILRVSVPSEVLGQAAFPLAIDPLISAEFGVDQPVPGPTPSTRAAPAIAAAASEYLIVWTHGRSDTTDLAVYGARVDGGGTLLDPYGILISASAGEQTVCAAAANGNSFLVAWAAPHGNSTTDWDILGARIASNGTVLDSTPLPICAMVSTVQNSPAVSANGDNYLVVWRDSRSTGIYGNIVTPNGTVSANNGFPISAAANDQYTPAVAALGTNYLVVWQDYRKATSSQYFSDIYGARVTGSGVLLDANGISIGTRTNSQFHPAVAANGTNYLVVWEEYDLAGNDIAGARVSPDGVILDTEAVAIAHAANFQANPAVSGSGGDFLVVWQDFRNSPSNNFEAQIYGARVRGDGSLADAIGFNISPGPGGQNSPAVAASGSQAFVVWQDFRNNPSTTFADIYGAGIEVTAALTVHPDSEVSGAANTEVGPALASNGTNFLVVWSDNRNALNSGRDIYGTRLDFEGSPLDLTALPICTATNHQTDPAVAANGGNYLVVWSDQRNAPDNNSPSDIYGTIVTSDGTVQQPAGLAICTATNQQSIPAISAFGTNFLVVWRDARNSLPTATRWDIYGARLTREGDLLDPSSIPVCTFLPDQTAPSVAANSNQALAVWIDSRGAAGASHVYGTRIGMDGSVVDTNGFVICAATGQQVTPAVASDGLGYLVVWADSRNGTASGFDIYWTTVDASGLVTPTGGFPIRLGPAPQTAPKIAFNGSDYLVAWQEGRVGSSNAFDIVGVSVGVNGSVAGSTPFLISGNPANQVSLALTTEPDGRYLALNQAFESASARTVGNLIQVLLLDSAGALSNGQFGFRLQGATGRRYGIEASDDLKSWSQIGTVLSTNPAMLFTDPASTNSLCRFYRAILLP